MHVRHMMPFMEQTKVSRVAQSVFSWKPPLRSDCISETHLSLCPETCQGQVPAGDVEAETVETGSWNLDSALSSV